MLVFVTLGTQNYSEKEYSWINQAWSHNIFPNIWLKKKAIKTQEHSLWQVNGR